MSIGRIALYCLLALLSSACQRSVEETYEFVTPLMKVEGLQASMTGPVDLRSLRLTEQAELVWIVGYEAQVLQGDGDEAESEEFLCHASLDVSPLVYQAQVRPPLTPSGRLFTLSQGATRVRFPEGFGLPYVTREPIRLETQVLNLNEQVKKQVRYRIRIHFVRDANLSSPMKALFLVRAPVVKAVDPKGAVFGKFLGESACSPGVNANPLDYVERDSEGEVFIPHWRLGAGRETSKTLITERLALHRDVTVHAMLAHLHPTAESLELIDLTAMEPVFRAQVKSPTDRLAIDEITDYSSAQGTVLKKDHEYGLVSVYNNESGKELDAMAVLYLYIHDPVYQAPSQLEVSLPLPPGAQLTRQEPDKTYEVPADFKLIEAFYQDALTEEPWQGPQEHSGRTSWSHPELELSLKEIDSRRTQIIIRNI